MAALPGKFARFSSPSGVSVFGPYRWNVGFRRERLDLTNFESTVSPDGINVFSDGTTGILDTTFQVEMYPQDANVNVFFPGASTTCDLLFRKNIALGYFGLIADVLDFSPSTSVREVAKATAQLQTSGFVPLAM